MQHTDIQYGLFEEFSERNKLGTKNLKTKERKMPLTHITSEIS